MQGTDFAMAQQEKRLELLEKTIAAQQQVIEALLRIENRVGGGSESPGKGRHGVPARRHRHHSGRTSSLSSGYCRNHRYDCAGSDSFERVDDAGMRRGLRDSRDAWEAGHYSDPQAPFSSGQHPSQYSGQYTAGVDPSSLRSHEPRTVRSFAEGAGGPGHANSDYMRYARQQEGESAASGGAFGAPFGASSGASSGAADGGKSSANGSEQRPSGISYSMVRRSVM
jgi:hypothetical protein